MNNVSESEINKFDQIASRWWDPEGEFKPLHDINPLRLSFIEQQVKLTNKRVLDVGCGGGILSESIAAKGAIVEGIDMSEAALSTARLHLKESGLNVDYHHSTIEAFAEQNANRYDLVSCMELLEHVPDPCSVIAACARATRPGGDLFFSTISRNAKSFLFAIVGAEYVLNMLPRGTHSYKKFINPSELEACARQCDLNIKHMAGMSYNPLLKTYSLNQDVSVNYLVHYQKPHEE